MEQLFENQKELVGQLNNTVRNFKSDPKARKKQLVYFDKKIENLEEWWRKFDSNNTQLAEFADDETEYFATGVFDKIKSIYVDHRTMLEESQKALKQKLVERENKKKEKLAMASSAAASTSTSFAAMNLDELKQIQEEQAFGGNELDSSDESDAENNDFLHQNSTMNDNDPPVVKVLKFQYNELKSALSIAEQLNQSASSGMAGAQLENVKLLWSEFRESFRNVSVSEHQEHCVAINFQSLQQEYLSAFGKLNDLANVKMRNKMVQLPQLKIPEFSGESRDWQSFKDLFDKIVHNNATISNDIKVQYLKTYIKGKAARLVSHVAPNADNYLTCYDILCNRYENKRENLGKFIDTIMSMEKVKFESSEGLKFIHDTAYECIMAINNIGVSTKNWDSLLVHILLKKLDSKTIVDYETQLKNVKEPQKLNDFLGYLEQRFLALASAESKNDMKNENRESFDKKKEKNKNKKDDSNFKCSYCEKSHSVYSCNELKSLEPSKRVEKVKEKKLCFVCLQPHKIDECKSKFKCKTCDKKHSTLLHVEKKSASHESKNAMCTMAQTIDSDSSEDDTRNVNALVAANSSSSVLCTAMVYVVAKSGEKFLLRALIDNCAESAFISEQAVQLLKLDKESVSASISGIGECERNSNRMVSMTIFSRFGDEFSLQTDAIVMKKLTKYKTMADKLSEYEHLKNLRLADTVTNCNEPVDIMLGTVEHAIIIKPGLVKGKPNEPIAQDSEFGWLISGGLGEKSKNKSVRAVSLVSNVEMNKKLDSFFASNDIDDNSDDECESSTDEEKYFEKFFNETTIRDKSGFIVRIPFKNKAEPKFGDSKKVALATLFQLENRFAKNAKLKQEYSDAMNDAIKKGHMKLLASEPKNAYFLPHHAVFKDSTTTKLRTVFNASQKSSNGLSLNDTVAVGKIKQPKMLELLVRWRKYKIAVVGDIEKMYKQIRIAEDQQHLLLILWRSEISKKIELYALTTVTFGVANAPCTAISVLEALANEIKQKYPMAANAILHHFYMDDCLCGADTVVGAIELYDQLRSAFSSAGFNIRKFVSNSSSFLQHVPDENKELNYDSFLKALGIIWCPALDTFEQKFNLNDDVVPTKRGLLSEIASLFDPLGIISPVITKAKIIMQDIWQLSNDSKRYDWDDKLPNEIVERWNQIKAELPILSEISIPRWIGISSCSSVQLHGFCDASEKAYAAVVYVRYRVNKSAHKVSLVMAKSRVAPIKKLKIPKLELMGALLLANLVKKVMRALNIEFERVFLWTDSKIVLAWIQGNPKRWKTFVSSRVLKIERKVKKNDWYHISGPENPADCGSRGILPSELKNHGLWWTGPSFLSESSFEAEKIVDFTTNEEIQFNTHVTVAKNEFLPECDSFFKLKRIFAYVLRFIDCAKSKEKKAGVIKLDELKKAEQKIIKIVQSECFEEELSMLKVGKPLKKTSNLLQLCVFIDEQQIIRVGGRLQNAIGLQYDHKHPVLISHRSKLCELLIKELHEDNFHAGPKLLEAKIREKFWITNIKSSIKKILKNCVTCTIHSPKTMSQLMGNLPAARVSETVNAFASCAIDFAGPITTKPSKLRNIPVMKGYIAIFVCLATKALHIEAVSDLTADSFVAALRRFVARRASVSNIYTDNGTNFVKANRILNELSEIEEKLFETKLHEESLKRNIKWHFSPPVSAHFNGLVEAAVKSTKFHLYRAFRNVNLTFEELTTALCQIEAVLNSRPICEQSSDPNDVSALTPSHLLNITSMKPIPDEDYSDVKSNYLSRWQMVQKVAQDFWRKWREEYLHQLQVRNKWSKKNADIKIGELVMIKDINVPSCKWPLGRVIELHPGADGLTRVVTVKTASNTLKRGITELAPLPVRS